MFPELHLYLTDPAKLTMATDRLSTVDGLYDLGYLYDLYDLCRDLFKVCIFYGPKPPLVKLSGWPTPAASRGDIDL